MTHQPEKPASVPFTPEYTGPVVEADIVGEKFTLTWRNTVVRTFFLEDGAIDHIAHLPTGGKPRGFPISMPGMEELRANLIANNFPQHLSLIHISEPTRQ